MIDLLIENENNFYLSKLVENEALKTDILDIKLLISIISFALSIAHFQSKTRLKKEIKLASFYTLLKVFFYK